MSDLIERQAAIDALYKIKCGLQMMDDTQIADKIMTGVHKADKAIRQLPPAQQWIPCSERLPEEETDVIICNAKGEIAISRGSRSTEVDDFIWYTSGWRFGEVVAWQPLPEPYREESNESN